MASSGAPPREPQAVARTPSGLLRNANTVAASLPLVGRGLPAHVADLLLTRAWLRPVAAGDLIAKQGDPIDFVVVVLSGTLSIHQRARPPARHAHAAAGGAASGSKAAAAAAGTSLSAAGRRSGAHGAPAPPDAANVRLFPIESGSGLGEHEQLSLVASAAAGREHARTLLETPALGSPCGSGAGRCPTKDAVDAYSRRLFNMVSVQRLHLLSSSSSLAAPAAGGAAIAAEAAAAAVDDPAAALQAEAPHLATVTVFRVKVSDDPRANPDGGPAAARLLAASGGFSRWTVAKAKAASQVARNKALEGAAAGLFGQVACAGLKLGAFFGLAEAAAGLAEFAATAVALDRALVALIPADDARSAFARAALCPLAALSLPPAPRRVATVVPAWAPAEVARLVASHPAWGWAAAAGGGALERLFCSEAGGGIALLPMNASLDGVLANARRSGAQWQQAALTRDSLPPAELLCVVVSGSLTLLDGRAPDGGAALSLFLPGDCFSSDQPAQLPIFAREVSVVAYAGLAALRALWQAAPAVARLCRALPQLLAAAERAPEERSDADVAAMEAPLADCEALSALATKCPRLRSAVVRTAVLQAFPAGAVLARQGHASRQFCVILQGAASVHLLDEESRLDAPFLPGGPEGGAAAAAAAGFFGPSITVGEGAAFGAPALDAALARADADLLAVDPHAAYTEQHTQAAGAAPAPALASNGRPNMNGPPCAVDSEESNWCPWSSEGISSHASSAQSIQSVTISSSTGSRAGSSGGGPRAGPALLAAAMLARGTVVARTAVTVLRFASADAAAAVAAACGADARQARLQLSLCPQFKHWLPSALEQLLPALRPRSYARGDLIAREGAVPTEVAIIRSGVAVESHGGPAAPRKQDSDDALLAVDGELAEPPALDTLREMLGRNAVVGYDAAVAGRPLHAGVHCASPLEAWVLPVAELRRAAPEDAAAHARRRSTMLELAGDQMPSGLFAHGHGAGHGAGASGLRALAGVNEGALAGALASWAHAPPPSSRFSGLDALAPRRPSGAPGDAATPAPAPGSALASGVHLPNIRSGKPTCGLPAWDEAMRRESLDQSVGSPSGPESSGFWAAAAAQLGPRYAARRRSRSGPSTPMRHSIGGTTRGAVQDPACGQRVSSLRNDEFAWAGGSGSEFTNETEDERRGTSLDSVGLRARLGCAGTGTNGSGPQSVLSFNPSLASGSRASFSGSSRSGSYPSTHASRSGDRDADGASDLAWLSPDPSTPTNRRSMDVADTSAARALALLRGGALQLPPIG